MIHGSTCCGERITLSRMPRQRDRPLAHLHEGYTVIMGLIIALVVVSILLVVVGIGVKGILWLAGIGALLLLATFVLLISGRTS